MAIKTKAIRAIPLDDKQVQKLEKILRKIFWEEIYKPLIDIVPAAKVTNSKIDVLSAIKTGRITFYRGEFKGTFTASLSRGLKSLGARWDRTQGSWKIPLDSLPPEYQEAVRISAANFNKTLAAFNGQLNQIQSEQMVNRIREKAHLKNYFDDTIFKLDGNLTKQLRGITVAPQLTDEQKLMIADEYNNNMEKYIVDFTEKEIQSLRKKVEQNVYSGDRYENMVKSIKKSYGVSEDKAKFLARQETNLLTSKYRQVRYEGAGSTGYIWRCVQGSPKHPVRPDHKKLDGKTIQWNSMPIVDSKTGRKAHAGEDFNCRCYPDVILRFDK